MVSEYNIYCIYILESAVAHSYVGLTGMFWTLIQKSTWKVLPFLRVFFFPYGLKLSSGYMGASMNK